MLNTPLAQISTCLVAGTVAWALVRGRWPERTAAIGLALDWSIDIAFQDHRLHHHTQEVGFAADTLLLLVLLGVVLTSRRTWVLWAAAIFLLTVLTHTAMLLDTRFGQWTYISALYVWDYGLIVTLAVGVAIEGRRPPGGPLPFRAPRPSIPSATARSRS